MNGPRHFGKYRGKVENNVDPLQLGRLQVSAPAVLGEGTLSWAMPCVPFAGDGVGFFMLPPTGASVWVEFEGGDPDWPIWSGCFWGTGQVPAAPAIAENKVIKTDSINLVICDLAGAGGITLEVSSPAVSMPSKIVIDSNGIKIEHSPGSVTITQDSIEIKHTSPTVVVQASSVEVTNSPSTLKITTSEIEAANGSSKVKVGASEVAVECTATGKFSAGGVELANGGQSLKVGAANVSVNSGALEVM